MKRGLEKIMNKILLVNGGAPPDITGSGLRAYRLAEQIHDSNQYDAYFCTYSDIKSNKIKHIKNYRLKIRVLNFIVFPINLFKNYQALRKNKFASIHFFGFGIISINIYIATFLVRKYHPKLIFGTTMFQLDDVNGIKNKRFSKLIFKAISGFDYIVCISDQLYKSWADYFKASQSPRVVKIFNPVNLEKFKPFNMIAQNETLRINYTGALKGRKQILFLLEAIKIAKKKYGLFFNLTIVGTYKGPDYMEKISEFVETNEMNQFIDFLGYRKNVEDYYNDSDVFIFASKTEGMPNVVIEAMASGLPIIMREIQDVSEVLVASNHNGFIIQSEEEMADKLWYYHKNRNILKNHSINSRNKAKENFNPKIIYKKYFELYESH